jgi:endonuclease-3 related protein
MPPSPSLHAIVISPPSLPGHAALKSAGVADSALSKSPSPALEVAGNSVLHGYFHALFAAYGRQHWWPGRSRFEVIVGAILTQNTAWKNVERALAALRSAKLLSPHAIREGEAARLAACLRPSGYFRQKAKTLKNFVDFLFADYGGSLNRLFAEPTERLRAQLLNLRGIGPETADSILLYAGKRPVFVVDAYARRILERHRLAGSEATYEKLRAMFESALPHSSALFNEFHALIVQTGKLHCRKSDPVCAACPLAKFLPQSDRARVTTHLSPATLP